MYDRDMADPSLHKNLSRRAFLFGRKAIENEDGATALEYGIIGALIGVGIIVGTRRLGRRTNRKMRCARNAVKREKRTKACN